MTKMTKHGFRARVQVIDVEFCGGKHNAKPYQSASMTLSGEILDCTDLGYSQIPHTFTPQENLAFVNITFTENPDDLPTLDLVELAPRCIGQLEVSASRVDQKPRALAEPIVEIRADLYLLLPWSMLSYLLNIRDDPIWVEPLFYVDDSRKKKTVTGESGVIRSFVQRVYFQPLIDH